VGWMSGFWATLTGRRREPEVVLPRVPRTEELLAAIDQIPAQIDGKVPSVIASRTDRVVRTLRDTIPRLDQLGAGNRHVHSVKASVTSYLPEILNGYLRLPRSYADTRPVEGNKTTLMNVVEQLELLSARLDDIFEAACREDAEAVIAHGEFLADKFGRSSLDLGSGPVPGSGGAAGLLPPSDGDGRAEDDRSGGTSR
jgi:hypothetical protein